MCAKQIRAEQPHATVGRIGPCPVQGIPLVAGQIYGAPLLMIRQNGYTDPFTGSSLTDLPHMAKPQPGDAPPIGRVI